MNDLSLIPKEVGAKIGQGAKREVFEYPGRPDLVVKRLKKTQKKGRRYSCPQANRREKAMYDALDGREEQRWLARVYAISPDGLFLVQERLQPVEHLPENIPDWMYEVNFLGHWGLSRDGDIKQCDFEGIEQRARFLKKFGVKIR